MAKDPAFLFYPGDWLSGTMYLTHEQKGAYMDLLILQFNVGKFTEAQAKQVLSICFDVAWPMLKLKFVLDDGLYFNERLQSEIEKRKSFSESRRNNAKGNKSIKKELNKSDTSAEHMLQHMEDENIIINIDTVLVNSIMDFYNFSEVNHHKKFVDINFFVKVLTKNKRIEHFKNQFKSYKILKDKDPKFKHNYENFRGSASDLFEDGMWNSENWTVKQAAEAKIIKSKFVP